MRPRDRQTAVRLETEGKCGLARGRGSRHRTSVDAKRIA
jgi:hypothetical protein